MSQAVALISHLVSKNNSVTDVINNGIADNSSVFSGSVENYLIENVSNFSVNEYVHKLSTTQLLSDPSTATDPEALFQVQKSILDYGLQMSLTSALTRKAIGAVEGLLRA